MNNQSMFLYSPDTTEKMAEYSEILMGGVKHVEQSILDQTTVLGADFQEIMLLDCATMTQFKKLRESAIHRKLWGNLMNMINFDLFYGPSVVNELKLGIQLPFTKEYADEFLKEYGTVSDQFKDRLAKEITALIDAGKWEKDILEDGRVIGFKFSHPAVVKSGDHYVLDGDLKRVMLRLEFLSLGESDYRYNQHNSIRNLSDQRVLPELHFNIGHPADRIQLMAYPTYFIIMAPKHMEALISKEEYLIPETI